MGLILAVEPWRVSGLEREHGNGYHLSEGICSLCGRVVGARAGGCSIACWPGQATTWVFHDVLSLRWFGRASRTLVTQPDRAGGVLAADWRPIAVPPPLRSLFSLFAGDAPGCDDQLPGWVAVVRALGAGVTLAGEQQITGMVMPWRAASTAAIRSCCGSSSSSTRQCRRSGWTVVRRAHLPQADAAPHRPASAGSSPAPGSTSHPSVRPRLRMPSLSLRHSMLHSHLTSQNYHQQLSDFRQHPLYPECASSLNCTTIVVLP
jgi:hypothetical protein